VATGRRIPYSKPRVVRATRSRRPLVVILAILLGVAAIVGVVALALPSLMKSRAPANEASVVSDIRSILEAQTAYARANGGYFDALECLARPAECIPGYPADGAPFLAEMLPMVKSGYEREFVPGTPPDRSEVAFQNLSPSSMLSYVYLAHPVTAGVTGTRSFCADYTGRICVGLDGSPLPIVNGQCDPSCTLYEE
jgi:type II secretory pathway pseudopilin PulG